jgi:tetratricopeptide (TPR) repeat protein
MKILARLPIRATLSEGQGPSQDLERAVQSVHPVEAAGAKPDYAGGVASQPKPYPAQRTGSLDETLASIGAGVAAVGELPLDRGDLIGRYVILEEVGRGAMGLVLAAYDPELDRKVALKLLPLAPESRGGGAAQAGASARLLREAQAMAKLSHPNVITVHDVGTAGDDVFIAMEFIEGGSLREWLQAAPKRSWQEIVATFIEAGEGLAAAHRQGIVHRDFKPDNVLVREDGRACVGDFGLARRDQGAAPTIPIEDMRSTLRNHPAEMALGGLTLTGAAMGTPAYMAPEQHLRTTVDARSDQFAFCVALWEALVGERPFSGSTLGAIALNVTTGKREPFPRDSAVPAKIRAAIERGLAISPEDRHPDMDRLLDELRVALRRDRRRSRARARWVALVAGGGVTLGLAVAGVGYWQSQARSNTGLPQPAPLCSGAEEHLDGIWDSEQRAAAERAFAASSFPYATTSFERVAGQLDRIRTEWIASHTRACEATRLYGEQSEEMLDRRMSCLAQRRSEIEAVAAALVTAAPETIGGADELLTAIAPVATCDDLPALEAGVPAPPPAAREQVEKLRSRLAKLEVSRRSRADGDLLEIAKQLVAEAEKLGYEPVLAEALHLQAKLLDSALGPTEALEVAQRAVSVAMRAGHHLELASALTLVAWIEGVGRANFDVGLWLLDLAEAEASTLGRPGTLMVRIMSDRASVLTIAGQFEAGLEQFEQALALAEKVLGPQHIRAADLRFNIAATRHHLGHHEQAERAFREALKVYTELMGPDHPEVAQCHNNLASTLVSRGEADEAELHARRAIAIWEQNGGHAYLPGAYANLGEVALLRKDHAGALAMFEKAHAMKLETFGPEHPTTIEAQMSIAQVELALGRLAEAEAHFEDCLARLRESAGPTHPDVFQIRLALAELARARGKAGEALERLRELETDARELGAEGERHLVGTLVLRAKIELEQGRAEAARATLDEAEAIVEPGVDEDLQVELRRLRAEL